MKPREAVPFQWIGSPTNSEFALLTGGAKYLPPLRQNRQWRFGRVSAPLTSTRFRRLFSLNEMAAAAALPSVGGFWKCRFQNL